MRRYTESQKTTILDAALCFVGMMVVLQLWLLTATMNAYLGGDAQVLLPAALASLACLLLNGGLLVVLIRGWRP